MREWGSQARNLYLLFPLAAICYHAAFSKPLPLIPIDGNFLSHSRDDCPIEFTTLPTTDINPVTAVALSGTLKVSKRQSNGRLIYGRCFSFRYNLCKEEGRSDTLFGLPKNCEKKGERETEQRGHQLRGSAILSNTYTHSNGDGPSKKLHNRVSRCSLTLN